MTWFFTFCFCHKRNSFDCDKKILSKAIKNGHPKVPASLILAKNVTKEPSLCHFLGAVKYQATPVTTEMMIRTSQFGCSCMPRMDIRMASIPNSNANVATVARIAFVRGDQDCIVKTFFPINLSAIVSRFSISR